MELARSDRRRVLLNVLYPTLCRITGCQAESSLIMTAVYLEHRKHTEDRVLLESEG